MGRTQYIGARYVPLFADPEEWSNTRTYEALTVVLHNGDSYTSKQAVPVGIDISNTEFWAHTGNYNAQVELYRQDTLSKAFAYDTVELMTRATNLFVGAICHTNGFHASGDGGAAWYVVSDTLPAGMAEANGMDVIACGELFAELVIDNDGVSVKQFGAYGNASNDDTAYFIRAIDKASSKRGTAIYIPINQGEQYRITETLVIDNPYTTIYSDAEYNLSWATSGIIFEASDIDSILFDVKASGCRFQNLRLETTQPYEDYKGIAIKAQIPNIPDTDINVNGCSFIHFDIAIKHYDRGLKVNDCLFAECTKCIEINTANLPNTGNNTMRAIIITRNRFHQVTYCVDVINSIISTIQLTSNYLDAPPTLTARALTLIHTDSLSQISGGLISGNTILDSHDFCIDVNQTFGLEISNNCFINRRGGNIEGFIRISELNNSSIISNTFVANLKNCIEIGIVKSSLITSNNFEFIAISATNDNKYSAILFNEISANTTVMITNNNIITYNANCHPVTYSGNNAINNTRITGNMSNRSVIFNNVNSVAINNSIIQNSNIT